MNVGLLSTGGAVPSTLSPMAPGVAMASMAPITPIVGEISVTDGVVTAIANNETKITMTKIVLII